MNPAPTLVTWNQEAATAWLESAREGASSLAAWLEIEHEQQCGTAAAWGQMLASDLGDAWRSGSPGDWVALPAQLWLKQAELALRRGVEWNTHLAEVGSLWAKRQHEQWSALVQPWFVPAVRP